MKTMNGSLDYPMSERIADTMKQHGFLWAYQYYVVEHGFEVWEFYILSGVTVRPALVWPVVERRN